MQAKRFKVAAVVTLNFTVLRLCKLHNIQAYSRPRDYRFSTSWGPQINPHYAVERREPPGQPRQVSRWAVSKTEFSVLLSSTFEPATVGESFDRQKLFQTKAVKLLIEIAVNW